MANETPTDAAWIEGIKWAGGIIVTILLSLSGYVINALNSRKAEMHKALDECEAAMRTELEKLEKRIDTVRGDASHANDILWLELKEQRQSATAAQDRVQQTLMHVATRTDLDTMEKRITSTLGGMIGRAKTIAD